MTPEEKKLLLAIADCVNICMELCEDRLRTDKLSPYLARLVQDRLIDARVTLAQSWPNSWRSTDDPGADQGAGGDAS